MGLAPLVRPGAGSWQSVRVRALRTAEERFADLPDFAYPPRYVDVGGLRMAYVEAGPAGGEPVLLLHGEPSWSFLYRTVMPVLVGARPGLGGTRRTARITEKTCLPRTVGRADVGLQLLSETFLQGSAHPLMMPCRPCSL